MIKKKNSNLNKKMFHMFFVLQVALLGSCVVEKSTLTVTMKDKKTAKNAIISSVQIINNQLVISGKGFENITTVKVDGHSLNEKFSIESKSNTQIIANSLKAFSFDVSKVFNLILSDAYASATFPIDFSICNSTLNGKGFNCLAPVSDKDVLSYDAISGTWKPRPASGLNYLGTFDASSNPASGPVIGVSGAYYIISDDGTIGAVPFAVGDWLVSNGSSWQKIDNSTAVLSVFNRTGAVVAQEGDYSLNLLSDVSLPGTPAVGKILKFDGTNWVAGDDLSGGGAGSVVTASIADGAVTDIKITSVAASKITGTINSTQILDGTIVNADINAAAAIDYSKLNIPNGSIPYAKLNIANGDIPAAKISGLPAVTSVLTTTITDNDTTHAPDGNAVFEALGLKLNLTGGSLTGGGTISNVPDPVAPGDVANRNFVDTKLAKTGGTMTGDLSLDADFRLKGTTNYVTFTADSATTTYTLTFPPTPGTSGYVLSTDGSGVLSWVSAGAASSLSTSIQAGVVINPYGVTAGDTGEIRFKELAAGGSNYVAIKAPDALAGDIAFVLPSVVGTSGQVLTTNGASPATLSWTTPTSVTGTTLTGDIGGTVGANTIGAGKVTLTHLNATGTKDNTTYLRGDNTWAALKADVLGTSLTSLSLATGTPVTAADSILVAMGKLQKQITDIPAGTSILATTISNSDTTHAPDGNAVFDALALKLNTAGGTVTGSLSLDTDLKLKGTSNYVTLIADAGTTTYTMTLPTSGGTNGQVLTSNGATPAVLTWTTPASATSATLTGDIGGTVGANTIGAAKVTLAHLSATGTKDNTTYLRGDNTWAALGAGVLATPLSGLSVATGTTITAADTVLSGMGKLQRQITNLPAAPIGTADATTYYAGDATWKTFDTSVRSAVLTGLSATGITKGTSSIVATDSALVAFNKLLFTQGDYISKTANQTIFGSLKVNSLTGFIEVPDPIGNLEAANKQYVDGKTGIWVAGAGGYSTTANTASTAIGIGTTTPGSTVTGSTLSFGGGSDRIIAVERHPTANTAGRSLTIQAGGATSGATNRDAGNLILSSGTATGSGKGKIFFRTVGNSSGGTSTTDRIPQDRVTIDDWGDVGIGTTTPFGPLNIYGPSRSATVTTESDSLNGGSFYPGFVANNYMGNPSTGSGGYPVLTLANYRGNFYTSSAPMRATEVLGSIAFMGSYTTSYNSYVGARIYSEATEDFGSNAGGSSLKFGTTLNGSSANAVRMTINHDGTVGIGKSPTVGNRLDVQGRINSNEITTSGKIESADVIKAANTIESASGLAVAGVVVCAAGGCTASSDLRLKENIKPLMSSYEKIQKMNGVSYDWKDKKRFTDKRQIGLIAQDLEKIYPEVVVTDKKSGLKSVAYDHLIAPIIEAFKELVFRNDKIERKVASVMAENSELKKENAEIKAYLCEKDPKAKICIK